MNKERLERVKMLSDIVIAWITLVALLVGGGFAYLQYLDKVRSDRIKYSFDFLQRYNEKVTFESRHRIADAWFKHDAEIKAKIGQRSYPEYADIVLQVIKTEELEPSLLELASFYEQLAVCIREAICDATSSRSLFNRDARAYFNAAIPYIHATREARKDPGFASDWELVAK